MTFDPTLVSVFGAVVSLASAGASIVFGLKSRRLAIEQERRKRPDLKADYLDYSITSQSHDEPSPTYSFHLKLTNRSETNAAVVEARLEITYPVGELAAKVKVPAETPDAPSGPPIQLPVRIDGRQAVQGWLYFRLGPELAARAPVFDSYLVVLVDSLGHETSVRPVFLGRR